MTGCFCTFREQRDLNKPSKNAGWWLAMIRVVILTLKSHHKFHCPLTGGNMQTHMVECLTPGKGIMLTRREESVSTGRGNSMYKGEIPPD